MSPFLPLPIPHHHHRLSSPLPGQTLHRTPLPHSTPLTESQAPVKALPSLVLQCGVGNNISTRQSSCEKLQDSYCLWHNLSTHNLPGSGYPIPGWGVPPSWPGQGDTQEYQPPIWDWGTPREGTWDRSIGYPSGKDVGSVEVLWDGEGVPPERTWDQWKYYGMEITPPPVWTDCKN